jgi:hypothetical protein
MPHITNPTITRRIRPTYLSKKTSIPSSIRPLNQSSIAHLLSDYHIAFIVSEYEIDTRRAA